MNRKRLLLAVLIGLAGFAMAHAVDFGLTSTWPAWARAVWAGVLVALVVVAAILVASATGLLSTARLNQPSIEPTPGGQPLTTSRVVKIYAGALAVSAVGATLVARSTPIPGSTAFVGIGGVLLLLAATRRPWWWYHSLRRIGGWAVIPAESVRILLALAGIVLLGLAVVSVRVAG